MFNQNYLGKAVELNNDENFSFPPRKPGIANPPVNP